MSVETVCGHTPKAALMIAALERAGFGVCGQENVVALLTVDDHTKAVDARTVMHVEMFERIAPLASALIGTGSSDAELDRYLTTTRASVHFQLRRILDIFRDHGWLRQDVAFDELVETAAVLCSAETDLQIARRDSRVGVRPPTEHGCDASLLRRSSMCRRQLNDGPRLLLSRDAAAGHRTQTLTQGPRKRWHVDVSAT
ncbi:hypothetical protein [Mycolicibacterium aurum]|uniref:hypothetical protein n=1 Tax=Mycolicibacterium aurum TaxID=1791 RepID=UPI000F82AFE3|nr:hypothetical protein [Mycolicibacterium aurum]